jgi:hypothetical protein
MTHAVARCSGTNNIIHTVYGRNAEYGMFEKVVQQVKTLLKSLFLLQLNIPLAKKLFSFFFFFTI